MFDVYVKDQKLIEEFAEVFVNLYDKKVDERAAQDHVKNSFGPNARFTQEVREKCKDLVEENNRLRQYTLELKRQIEFWKQRKRRF